MKIKRNSIHYILFITGIVVVFTGIVTSISNGGTESINEFDEISNNFSFSLMFSIMFPYVVTGIVLIGLSEVVNLLQKLINHIIGMPERVEPVFNGLVENKDKEEVSLATKVEINMFYEEKSLQIDEIRPTKFEDFYIVIRGNDKDLVELGGFHPIIVSNERLEHSQTLRELLQ